MRNLLLIDLKSVKNILIIYYVILLFVTIFIYPIAGWVVLLFIIKIERDVCNDNALMGLPAFYKNFPKKYLYADEKNLFFYLVILVAILLWGGACFAVEINDYSGFMEKIRLIIGLGMILLIVCGIYHISWFHFFFKYFDVRKSIQSAGKYYFIIALLFVLLSKNNFLYKKVRELLQFKANTCIILGIINLVVLLISIWYLRKSYEKSEVS